MTKKKNGGSKRTRGKFFLLADIEHQEEDPVPPETGHSLSVDVVTDDEDIEMVYSGDGMTEIEGSGSGAGPS